MPVRCVQFLMHEKPKYILLMMDIMDVQGVVDERSLVDHIIRELIRDSNGVVVITGNTVWKVLRRLGVVVDKSTFARLFLMVRSQARKYGFVYVGSYVAGGRRHHVLVKLGSSVPKHIQDMIAASNASMHDAVPSIVVRKILERLSSYRVSTANGGLYRLTTKQIMDLISEEPRTGMKRVSSWLVNEVIARLEEAGFEVRKTRNSRHVVIYFHRKSEEPLKKREGNQ